MGRRISVAERDSSNCRWRFPVERARSFHIELVSSPGNCGFRDISWRVENQLGYKMVKWIERIEFIESEKMFGKGEGGANEDDEYFDLLPNI